MLFKSRFYICFSWRLFFWNAQYKLKLLFTTVSCPESLSKYESSNIKNRKNYFCESRKQHEIVIDVCWSGRSSFCGKPSSTVELYTAAPNAFYKFKATEMKSFKKFVVEGIYFCTYRTRDFCFYYQISANNTTTCEKLQKNARVKRFYCWG